MKRVLFTIALLISLVFQAWAKPIDDAKKLYAQGQYAEAIEKLKPIIKATPKDGTANYYLGMSYVHLGDLEAAKKPLAMASERGVADANRQLAEIAMGQYDTDGATRHLEAWERQLKKDKKDVPESLTEMRSELILIKNMLERVEKIAIIDSLVVDSANFFKYYRITKDAGRIYDGSVLDGITDGASHARLVYRPENAKEMFWAMEDSTGALALASALVLDDGKVAEVNFLDGDLGQGGDADFPFFMPDGQTFYFANNGENSIGGYDIFFTRRQTDGKVYDPQNMGMPYNSPYDDYMLVIDEAAGLGWWATDRNQIPGKVTIYVFIPNASRVNYDPTDPKLLDYARVTSIAETQPEGNPQHALLDNPALLEPDAMIDAAEKTSDFEVYIKGRRYTSLDQFRNPQARQAMQQYLNKEANLQVQRARLEVLRRTYAGGNKSVAQEILTLEKTLLDSRPTQQRLLNQAISLESK